MCGLSVVDLQLVGLTIVGFPIFRLSLVGFPIFRLSFAGLPIFRLSFAGLPIFRPVVAGIPVAGLPVGRRTRFDEDPMKVGGRAAPRSLMARAIGLLARREHSRVELARKLQRHLGPDETLADIERVLDRLQQQDLLSDRRFAASLVRQRSSRYGDLRLTRDLRERGVPDADAEAALQGVQGTEARRAHETWARRFDTLPTSREERGRQGRYLQARGFTMDVIVQVLGGKVDPIDS